MLEEALEAGEQERERLRSQLARLKAQMMTEQVQGCFADSSYIPDGRYSSLKSSFRCLSGSRAVVTLKTHINTVQVPGIGCSYHRNDCFFLGLR